MHIDILFLSCLMGKRKIHSCGCVCVCARVLCRMTENDWKRKTHTNRKLFFLLDMKERGYWSNRSAVFRCLRATTVMAHRCVDRRNLFFFRLITETQLDLGRSTATKRKRHSLSWTKTDIPHLWLIDQIRLSLSRMKDTSVTVVEGRRRKREPEEFFFVCQTMCHSWRHSVCRVVAIR